jgi:hypothetical protein
MTKALIVLIYKAIISDYRQAENKERLEWSMLDVVGSPRHEEKVSTIYIKGDNGGKDYKITVEEV